MVTIILVSHSKGITDGLRDMILEMTGSHDHIRIVSAGGTFDDRLGTDPTKILEAIEENKDSDNIYIFGDIGSGLLSIDLAIELFDDEDYKKNIYHFNAPLVEGGFTAGVQCLVDPSPEAVINELTNCIDLMQVIERS